MENAECPQCCEQTITAKQKFKTGKWSTIFCPSCNGRMCAQPIVLALMYVVLTWNFLFFGYLAVSESSIIYAAILVVVWAIIEFFIFYVPLSRMRALQKPNNDNGSQERTQEESQKRDHKDKDTSDG